MEHHIVGSYGSFAIEFEVCSAADVFSAKTRIWMKGRSIGPYEEEYFWPFINSVRGSLMSGIDDLVHIEMDDLEDPDRLFSELTDLERWKARFPEWAEHLYDRHMVTPGLGYDMYVARRALLNDDVIFVWQWWPQNGYDLEVQHDYDPLTTQIALVKRTELDTVCRQFLALVKSE